jgi:phosphonate transport system permease protein
MASTNLKEVNKLFRSRKLSTIYIVLGFILLGYISSAFVGFDLIAAIKDLFGGFVWFVSNFMPELSSFKEMDRIAPALLSTVLDSVAASCTAAIFAYFFAILGSRSVGLGGPVPLIVRAIASIFRNIPVVAWAFLLLFSFKQSEFTGYLALFLQSFGFLTRCFLESLDELEKGPIEALRATGASYFQIVTRAVIPMSITQVVSWVLYMIETNIRDATLVGMLTGTGIGFVFDLYYKQFDYAEAGLVLVCVIVVVIICETLSNFIRRSLLEPPSNTHGIEKTQSGKIKKHVRERYNNILCIVIAAIVLITLYTFFQMDFGKATLSQAFHDFVSDFFVMATQPHVNGHFEYLTLVSELFVTFALSILTTLGAAIVALMLGLFAASNLSNRLVSNIIKIVMSVIRAVPTILWVLVFTVAIGLGPEAAVIGMLFHGVGYLVKAYSESFEEVDPGALEALRASGASWWQIVAQCVLPEKINEILSWTFIRFEINFVAAVVVAGMAGSGGIGYSLFLAGYYYFDIHEIGLIIYLCLFISVVLEFIATKLRKRYIVNK